MGLMKKLTSAIVASSLVLSLVGTAFAAYTPAAGETAGNRMMALKVLNGKTVTDPLSLKDEITRAELVTIIVRAFGQEDNAKLLVGATAYPDTASHWASGNIAMAKALIEKQGESMGMPDGTFAPDAKLTPAQAVAFLMKFLGVKADATKTWPANYLDAAVTAGLIASGDKDIIAPMLNDNATRGLVFYLFDSAFFSYDLGAGKTFYTKYVDTMAPVVTLNAVPATTLDSMVTVSGKVEGAKEVYVGTTAVTLAADGTFSTEFALAEMKEYTITVTARDAAGNAAEKSATVTRTVGAIATVEAAAITVAAGATVDVAAVAKDAKGNIIANATITGESAVGTYAAGKFTAATTAGAGKLTLTANGVTANVDVTVVAGPIAKVEASKAASAPGEFVTLTAKDQHGNVVTGATFSQTSADAMLDGATGKFMASKAGSYTVTATKDGVSATGTVAVFGAIKKVVVTAPETVIANNETSVTLKFAVADKDGNVVTDWEGFLSVTTDLTRTNGGALNSYDVWATDGVAELAVKSPGTLAGVDVAIDVEALNPDSPGMDDSYTTAVVGSASIEAIAQVPTKLEVSAAKYLNANTSAGGSAINEVMVLDQVGEVMLTGSWLVDLTLSGPATFTSGSDDKSEQLVVNMGAEDYDITIYPTETGDTGTVTMTASFTGLGTASGTTSALIAQSTSKVNLSAVTTSARKAANAQGYVVKVETTDKNGVPVNFTGDVTVTLDVSTSKAAQITYKTGDSTTAAAQAGATALSSKKATVSFDGSSSVKYLYVYANAFTGDLNLTATNSSLTTGTGAAVSFKASDLDYLAWTKDELNVLLTDAKGTVSVQAKDAAGNDVKQAGIKVEFEANGTAAQNNRVTIAKETVLTDANGMASTEVSIQSYPGAYPISATASSNGVDYVVEMGTADDVADDIDVTVASAIAKSMTVSLYDALDTNRKTQVTAGETVTIRVYVKDTFGNYMDNITHTPTAFKLDVTSGSIVGSATAFAYEGLDASDNAYFTATAVAKASGLLTFQVTDLTIAAEVKAAKSLNVIAGTPAELEVSEAYAVLTVPNIDVKTGVAKAFTFRLVDAQGNLVNASDVTSDVVFSYTFDTVSVTAAGEIAGTVAELRSSTEGGALANLTFKAGTNSKTVYVIANGKGDTTLDINAPAAPAFGNTITIDTIQVNVK